MTKKRCCDCDSDLTNDRIVLRSEKREVKRNGKKVETKSKYQSSSPSQLVLIVRAKGIDGKEVHDPKAKA